MGRQMDPAENAELESLISADRFVPKRTIAGSVQGSIPTKNDPTVEKRSAVRTLRATFRKLLFSGPACGALAAVTVQSRLGLSDRETFTGQYSSMRPRSMRITSTARRRGWISARIRYQAVVIRHWVRRDSQGVQE
jgi:hypothetical protein